MDLAERIKQLVNDSGLDAAGRQDAMRRAMEDLFVSPSPVVVLERQGPTRSFKDKVKTLEELKPLVAQWRAEGDDSIGVTSGVFDIVHPGHVSFLEDSHRHCKRLIVVIASDRTVKQQKGEERPFISELKRAQTIAAMENVDAVIVSDELYHETILDALKPDILFKGDDYAGQTIIGADKVGQVILIPCAEKEFYSSTEFVRRIRAEQARNDGAREL